MRFILERLWDNTKASIGTLGYTLGGLQRRLMFTLEDEHRDNKEVGETRIPEGGYVIVPRRGSPMDKRYEAKFPWHRSGMMQILPENAIKYDSGDGWSFRDGYSLETPIRNAAGDEWKYILFHIGNDEDDTDGCVLTGKGADLTSMTVSHSTNAYEELYKLVSGAWKQNQTVRLTITDLDNL